MAVVQFPRPDHREWVSKPALAAIHGFSTRWVELRMAEGMPSVLENGVRRYNVREVEAWLANRPTPQTPVDRVGALVAEVRELRAIVEDLQRRIA